MSAEKPRYIPSDAVKSHPVWNFSSLREYAEENGDGSVSMQRVRSYVISANPARNFGTFNIRSWYAAVLWDIKRWAEENGVEL